MDENQRYQSNNFNQNQEGKAGGPPIYQANVGDQDNPYLRNVNAKQKKSRNKLLIGVVSCLIIISLIFVAGTGIVAFKILSRSSATEDDVLYQGNHKSIGNLYEFKQNQNEEAEREPETKGTIPEGNGILPPDEQEAEPAENDLQDEDFSFEKAAQRKDRPNLTIAEIVEKEKAGVVAIMTDTQLMTNFGPQKQTGAGSGFIISKDGYVVTNNHVVQGADKIQVLLESGETVDAQLVGTDPLNDIAVLKIEGDDYHAVDLGDSDDLKVGELAVAIGNPAGILSGSVTSGIISALQRNINIQGIDMTLMQTDAAINKGNSGGALFNGRGQVIGINTAKLSSESNSFFEGLGFAIPINIAKPVIEDLIRHGKVTNRAGLGIVGQPVGERLLLGPNDAGGVYVVDLVPDGPADKAGIKQGDVIVKFDGNRVTTPMEINNLQKNKKAGDQVEIEFVRKREIKSTTVSLEALDDLNYDGVGNGPSEAGDN